MAPVAVDVIKTIDPMVILRARGNQSRKSLFEVQLMIFSTKGQFSPFKK